MMGTLVARLATGAVLVAAGLWSAQPANASVRPADASDCYTWLGSISTGAAYCATGPGQFFAVAHCFPPFFGSTYYRSGPLKTAGLGDPSWAVCDAGDSPIIYVHFL